MCLRQALRMRTKRLADDGGSGDEIMMEIIEIRGPTTTRAGLSSAKRKLFELLLARTGIILPPLKTVPDEPECDLHLLSLEQERLRFVTRPAPAAASADISPLLRLTGRLNRPALSQAVNEIARRCDILRTSFPTSDGKPVQKVASELKIVFFRSRLQRTASGSARSIGVAGG